MESCRIQVPRRPYVPGDTMSNPTPHIPDERLHELGRIAEPFFGCDDLEVRADELIQLVNEIIERRASSPPVVKEEEGWREKFDALRVAYAEWYAVTAKRDKGPKALNLLISAVTDLVYCPVPVSTKGAGE
jgi:hypothetical protein